MIYTHVLHRGPAGVRSRNPLKWQRPWHYIHESQWPVIWTEIGRSGSYADWPKLSLCIAPE